VVLYDQNTLANELRHIFRSSPIPGGQRKGSNKLPRNPFEVTDERDAIERVAKERNVPATRLIATQRPRRTQEPWMSSCRISLPLVSRNCPAFRAAGAIVARVDRQR
jgi:hypothetical protein